jgi:hypothetical protein
VTALPSIIGVALAAAFAAAGSAQAIDAEKPASAQAPVPVFDCFATNSAWGFMLSGKFIDADGNIFSYGHRGKAWLVTPVTEQGAKYYAEADLQDKFGDARRTGNVDAAALADNTTLIDAAGNGKLTIADGGARDAGSSSCHAYVHDAARKRYRDIELGSDGGVSDTRMTNDAPEAQQLLKWLRSVGVAQ